MPRPQRGEVEPVYGPFLQGKSYLYVHTTSTNNRKYYIEAYLQSCTDSYIPPNTSTCTTSTSSRHLTYLSTCTVIIICISDRHVYRSLYAVSTHILLFVPIYMYTYISIEIHNLCLYTSLHINYVLYLDRYHEIAFYNCIPAYQLNVNLLTKIPDTSTYLSR